MNKINNNKVRENKMKLTEEQKLGLRSLGFELNNSHIAMYKCHFKDEEAFDIIAENLNIKNATSIEFAIVGFKGGYKKSELKETFLRGEK
tara:strand:- start:10 stop:279 length:270 start_codon:yes stop_codon:yes gene_type:complete